MTLTPEQIRLRGAAGAHKSWANTKDRQARTAKAREARWQRYRDRAREIHAGVEVTDEFIDQVAEHLRQADLKAMAFKSARARQRKAAAKQAG